MLGSELGLSVPFIRPCVETDRENTRFAILNIRVRVRVRVRDRFRVRARVTVRVRVRVR